MSELTLEAIGRELVCYIQIELLEFSFGKECSMPMCACYLDETPESRFSYTSTEYRWCDSHDAHLGVYMYAPRQCNIAYTTYT